MNAAVPVCAVRDGGYLHLTRGDVVLRYGCCKPPVQGSLCCAAPSSAATVPTTQRRCPAGHRLRRKKLKEDSACHMCGDALAKNDVFWSCALGCAWGCCHACVVPPAALSSDSAMVAACDDAVASSDSSRLPISRDSLQQVQHQGALLEADLLEEVSTRAASASMTPSPWGGRVAFVLPIAGHESMSQVYGMLAAVRTRREMSHVVYDNACCLALFIRGLQRRRPSGIRTQCSQLYFVLDRWHKQNHTACLDLTNPRYLPEVDIDRHPTLANYNSSNSEQFNAWLELFVPITRAMRPETYDCFLILLARLWNDFVIPKRAASTLPAPLDRPMLLKRPRSHV